MKEEVMNYFANIFAFNNYFWFIFAIINFFMIVGVYKLFGKLGLFAWVVIGAFVANLQVIKFVDLFFFEAATLGNIMYGTIFLATDVLNEKYGKKEAKKAVYLSFVILIAITIIMRLSLLFIPSDIDTMQPHLEAIFTQVPQVVIASLIAYILSQLLDVYIFSKLKENKKSARLLWLRNNGSTMVSQLIDTFIFVTIAFVGQLDFSTILAIGVSTYFIKVTVAALDTPFIYWMNKITPLHQKELE